MLGLLKISGVITGPKGDFDGSGILLNVAEGGPVTCIGVGDSTGGCGSGEVDCFCFGGLPSFGLDSSMVFSGSFTALRSCQCLSSVLIDPSAQLPTFILTVDRDNLLTMEKGPVNGGSSPFWSCCLV